MKMHKLLLLFLCFTGSVALICSEDSPHTRVMAAGMDVSGYSKKRSAVNPETSVSPDPQSCFCCRARETVLSFLARMQASQNRSMFGSSENAPKVLPLFLFGD